jgi:hypothetical protein
MTIQEWEHLAAECLCVALIAYQVVGWALNQWAIYELLASIH